MGRECGWGRRLGVAVAWAAGVACTQPTNRPGELVNPPPVGHDSGSIVNPGGDDASTDDGGAACNAPGTNDCNDLTNCGSQVHVVQVAQDAPTPSGGSVADGTYVLTAFNRYTGSGGASGPNATWFSETMRIASGAGDGGATAWADTSTNSMAASASFNAGTISFTAPDLVEIDYTCPGRSPFPATYSASATSLTLFYMDPGGGVDAPTYTKQ